MRGQRDLDTIVDIGPFGVMIARFRDHVTDWERSEYLELY